MHLLLVPDLSRVSPGTEITVTGPEAHHALRVRRLDIGEHLLLGDGEGTRARARLTGSDKDRREGGWIARVTIDTLERIPPTRPRLTVLTPAPKGERLEWMIDGLSQAGALAWGLLDTARAVVDPREGKLQRLERTCDESLKQCQRAWRMRIEAHPSTLTSACARTGLLLVAHAQGAPPADLAPALRDAARTDTPVTLLVGPEGGLTEGELAQIAAAGARSLLLSPHVLRLETAAVAGACAVMSHAADGPITS